MIRSPSAVLGRWVLTRSWAARLRRRTVRSPAQARDLESLPGTESRKPPTQEPLLTALARAFHWQELIDSGKYGSITEVSGALQVGRSYVGRILRLALLAPDIVEAIVSGNEPSGLSLERLVKAMPMVWEEQRETIEFAGR